MTFVGCVLSLTSSLTAKKTANFVERVEAYANTVLRGVPELA